MRACIATAPNSTSLKVDFETFSHLFYGKTLFFKARVAISMHVARMRLKRGMFNSTIV
jgi:hypothetical protein